MLELAARRVPHLFLIGALLAMGGCATFLPDARIEHVDASAGYRIETELERASRSDPETLLLIAFSGGGMRAAAFAYGVLEELRRTPVVVAGRAERMLDQIDAISGVSGGSFTALAYASHGERLFEVFEPRFLKRDVQGSLIGDLLNPLNWPSMMFGHYNRSDLAALYYDKILFDGATFGDLADKPGPLVVVSATDFSTGSRFTFTQGAFDLICTDLSRFHLAMAATASSAVPVAFAPVSMRNWGGTCGLELPKWISQADKLAAADSLSLRLRLKNMLQLQNGAERPWLHLVDGGISDNLGLRAFIDLLEAIKVREDVRRQLGLVQVRRVAVIVVNALSGAPPAWSDSPGGPGLLETVLQTASVPIDHNSMDSILLMQSMIERWRLQSEVQTLKARFEHAAPPQPPIEFYPIFLAFEDMPDATERTYLNGLPTSFTLPPDAVDRLRAAAALLLREAPEFQRFVKTYGQESN